MSKKDVFYAFGIVLFVGAIAFMLNERQNGLTSNVVAEDIEESLTCIFDTEGTCFVHIDSHLYSCHGRTCSMTMKGPGTAIVTSDCGGEFYAKIDGKKEIFMFSC